MDFSYEITKEDDKTILKINGDLKLTGGEDLKDVLEDYFNKHIPTDLIIDLSSVPYMDSSGLSFLVYTDRKCEENETTFALRSPSKVVSDILDVTELNKSFRIID